MPELLVEDRPFLFSESLHHPMISFEGTTKIRSISGYQYQYALLEPSLELMIDTFEVTFKSSELNSVWLAVGLCYREVVEGKNFMFDSSESSHGAFLLCNSGNTWSHTQPELNNESSSFFFNEEETITVRVSPASQQLTFLKKGQPESYSLAYRESPEFKLHLCVVLYNPNHAVMILD